VRQLSVPPESLAQRWARRAPSRRGFLAGTAGLLGATALSGCDRFAGTEWGRRTLRVGEDANLFVQRLLLTPASLAKEFPESQISPWFKPNGTVDPEDAAYKALAKDGFSTFTLKIDGLVERPQSLSLTELRALPSRTQITRHDCVEGWSAIGKWTGVPLAELLNRAGLKPQARYIVFHCADTMEMAGGGLEGGEAADEAASGGATEPAPSSGGLAWGGASDEDKPGDAKSSGAKSDGAKSSDAKSSGGLAWGGASEETKGQADAAQSGDARTAGGAGKAADAKTTDTKADAKRSGDPKKSSSNPDMEARPAGAETRASDSEAAQGTAQGSQEGGQGGGQGGRPIRYYESIDLTDAFHPQTILAYDMNGKTLPVSNGAPLRLRLERQIGYKQAKYVMRIEVVDSLAPFGDGQGGYWEDRGYEWYAGI